MSQLVLRNLSRGDRERLQLRASRHGRTIEEEAAAILRGTLSEEEPRLCGLGTAMAALFRDSGFEGHIPDLRSYLTPAVTPRRISSRISSRPRSRVRSNRQPPNRAPDRGDH